MYNIGDIIILVNGIEAEIVSVYKIKGGSIAYAVFISPDGEYKMHKHPPISSWTLIAGYDCKKYSDKPRYYIEYHSGLKLKYSIYNDIDLIIQKLETHGKNIDREFSISSSEY